MITKRDKILVTIGIVIVAMLIMGVFALRFTIRKQTREKAESLLEEKYGEPFECLSFWNVGYGNVRMVCCPKGNPNLRFEFELFMGGKRLMENYYSAQIAYSYYKPINEKLKDTFEEYYLYEYMSDPIRSQKNGDLVSIKGREKKLDIEEYMKMDQKYHHREDITKITNVIFVNTKHKNKVDFETEYEVLKECAALAEKDGLNCNTQLKFMPNFAYKKAVKILSKTYRMNMGTEINSYVEEYPINRIRDVLVEFEDEPIIDGGDFITKEEYIQMREDMTYGTNK